MKNTENCGIMKTQREGLKDVWNAYMCEGASFTPNDIPRCRTTATRLPTDVINWDEAKAIYKKRIAKKEYDFKYKAFVCFYMDDYKFDGVRGIWHDAKQCLKVLRHFEGAITPDFSTYQDFPEPLKLYNTYRMRAFGHWLGKNGIEVINNIRWGTVETYRYCYDGVDTESMIAIGTVGGSPRKYEDRQRFVEGFEEMIKVLRPKIIVVYGSSDYPCFEKAKAQGIQIVTFKSQTARAFERRKNNE